MFTLPWWPLRPPPNGNISSWDKADFERRYRLELALATASLCGGEIEHVEKEKYVGVLYRPVIGR